MIDCELFLGGNPWHSYLRGFQSVASSSEGSIFRRFYVPKILCSEGSIFRRFYVPKVLCSELVLRTISLTDNDIII